jgi:NDP-sugar pyrophosphorylase family protein
MKAVLICPSERPQVDVLSLAAAFAAVPMIGQTLLEYWLSDLAGAGVRDVLLLADDRPDQISAIAGEGERWGLRIKVQYEETELTPAQALLKYQKELEVAPPNKHLAVLDHFPGLAQYPLFVNYAGWFAALQAWLPKANTPDRVDFKIVAPGVYSGLRTRIARTAELPPPVWIGGNVIVSDGVVLGPHAYIEKGAVIERHAEVSHSYIGPDTFVGAYAEIHNSIASGSTLLNWRTSSSVQVPDALVLSWLRRPKQGKAETRKQRAETWPRSPSA